MDVLENFWQVSCDELEAQVYDRGEIEEVAYGDSDAWA
jgi:hypothetical protein